MEFVNRIEGQFFFVLSPHLRSPRRIVKGSLHLWLPDQLQAAMGIHSVFFWPQVHVDLGAMAVAKLEQTLKLSPQLTKLSVEQWTVGREGPGSEGSLLIEEARVGDLEFLLGS